MLVGLPASDSMPTYRRDIDGLRAIAVLAVVFNHAGFPGFGGGFLGVDIFFVISGYLITGILIRADGTLGQDIVRFYERRVRRIVPALVVVLVACTAAAAVLVSPYEFKEYARPLLASVAFVSNLLFEMKTDYFAPHLATPLLHLWSLSVEEQFYLVYPLFLWFVSRRAPRFLLPSLIVVLVLSLAMSEWLAQTHARHAFYFTGSRAWELMLGAIVAIVPHRGALPRLALEGAAIAALAMLVAPIWLFDLHTTWPGLHALLPCAGTATLLILHAGGRQSQTSRLLGTKPMVAVGLISYSLYLWHWPLFVFYRRYVLRVPSPEEYGALIGLAVLAAALSWRYVEQPFRRADDGLPRQILFGSAGAAAALLMLVGAVIFLANGVPQRFGPNDNHIYAYMLESRTAEYRRAFNFGTCFASIAQETYNFGQCYRPLPDRTNVVLWGDSHAMHYYAGLHAESLKTRVNLIEATFHGCVPALEGLNRKCTDFNREILRRLDRRIDVVILAARLTNRPFLVGPLLDMARKIVQKGIRVIVLGPAVEYSAQEPLYIQRYLATKDAAFLDSRGRLNPQARVLDDELHALFAHEPGTSFISVLSTMCHADRCPMLAGSAPTQFDDAHLTLEGSRLFGRALWPPIYAAIEGHRESGSPH